MDKNTIIGLVLIGVLLVGFSILSRPSQEQLEEPSNTTTTPSPRCSNERPNSRPGRKPPWRTSDWPRETHPPSSAKPCTARTGR